jgi:CRISPR system Cascade subunit CasD
MSDQYKWLVLYFDAPMQSWGFQSRLDRRTTLGYPTKSGVVGVLCAAIGIPRNDRYNIRQLATLDMNVLVLSAAQRLTDFHTVGGGYDSKLQKECIPAKVDGGTPATVITYREYLVDGKFAVLLHGEAALLERCECSLRDPKWGVWLGRKSCVPAAPICHGVFSTKKEAIKHIEGVSGRSAIFEIKEAAQFDDGMDTLSDVPLDYSTREFSVRRVVKESVKR